MTGSIGPRGLSLLIFAALIALAAVLGLAVCLTGSRNQRLVMRG